MWDLREDPPVDLLSRHGSENAQHGEPPVLDLNIQLPPLRGLVPNSHTEIAKSEVSRGVALLQNNAC